MNSEDKFSFLMFLMVMLLLFISFCIGGATQIKEKALLENELEMLKFEGLNNGAFVLDKETREPIWSKGNFEE